MAQTARLNSNPAKVKGIQELVLPIKNDYPPVHINVYVVLLGMLETA